MRDLVLTLLVLGAIPWIFTRPYFGALMYAWLSLMQPHRLTWGFAFTFPFSTVIGIVTIIATLFSKERKQVPWSGPFVLLLLFVAWINVSTYFALDTDGAIPEWDRTMKIQLMVFVTLLLMQGKQRINAFVWVIVVSLAFFGFKGGIFTISTGGQYLVRGPTRSFIDDNNTLALALLMILPLLWYLFSVSTNKYVKYGVLTTMILTTISITGSHSRGALVAGGAVLFMLALRSRQRVKFLIAAAVVIPAILSFMPEVWFERMGTISTYQSDGSALGRINAWWFAVNIADAHPITGGGFGVFTAENFLSYAPEPLNFHDAHSIYFEVLAEHGYVGIALFLALGLASLRSCSWTMKNTRDRPDLKWASDLAGMLQASLIGYATGGLFLGLAYYDLYYDLVGVVILLQVHIREVLASAETEGVVVSGIENQNPVSSELAELDDSTRRRESRVAVR